MATEKDIFINGKMQAIEILQMLTESERSRILNSLTARNPNIASELKAGSFTFESLMSTNNETLITILEYISHPIIAIAIKFLHKEQQKKVFKSMSRQKAEKAFQIFNSRKTTPEEAQKAQKKIMDVVSELSLKKIIQI